MWFEHEYAERELADRDVGWDRFTLNLDDGRDVDVRFTRTRGGTVLAASGVAVSSDGKAQFITGPALATRTVWADTHWRSPHTEIRYPSLWTLSVGPAHLGLDVDDAALDQEVTEAEGSSYYLGAVDVIGANDENHGHGFVELTGYDVPLRL